MTARLLLWDLSPLAVYLLMLWGFRRASGPRFTWPAIQWSAGLLVLASYLFYLLPVTALSGGHPVAPEHEQEARLISYWMFPVYQYAILALIFAVFLIFAAIVSAGPAPGGETASPSR